MADSTDKIRPDRTHIAGIILAAGTGSRMGQTKQLLAFKGRPILAHTIDQGLAAGLCPLILVLGHQAGRIKSQLPRRPIDMIINKAYPSGMASSIKTGLKRVGQYPGKPFRGAVFLLGDQPLVPPETITRILTAAGKSPGKIIVPTFGGRRGNPVYFDACFFHQLNQLSGDTGGREIIRQFPHAVDEIRVSTPGICQDIDTPEDYLWLCQSQKGKNETD